MLDTTILVAKTQTRIFVFCKNRFLKFLTDGVKMGFRSRPMVFQIIFNNVDRRWSLYFLKFVIRVRLYDYIKKSAHRKHDSSIRGQQHSKLRLLCTVSSIILLFFSQSSESSSLQKAADRGQKRRYSQIVCQASRSSSGATRPRGDDSGPYLFLPPKIKRAIAICWLGQASVYTTVVGQQQRERTVWIVKYRLNKFHNRFVFETQQNKWMPARHKK